MAYASVPDDMPTILAAIHRRHREMARLTRWVRLCGVEASEAQIDANDTAYMAHRTSLRALDKARRAAR